jgi:hypothetical protein
VGEEGPVVVSALLRLWESVGVCVGVVVSGGRFVRVQVLLCAGRYRRLVMGLININSEGIRTSYVSCGRAVR